MVLNWLRNKTYWASDKIKNGNVEKYINNLCRINESTGDCCCIEKYQQEQIDKLLKYVFELVPYYSRFKDCDFLNLPIVNKATIKENYESFISNEYVNQRNKLIEMRTSGSTGTPFVSLQNIDKKRHVNAETIYYMGRTGYKVGDRIIYLRAVVTECKKTRFESFKTNIYQVDCFDLSDAGIENILRQIKDLAGHKGAYILGYSSTFSAIKGYFNRNGANIVKEIKINAIIAGSDMLYDDTRKSMETAFNCRCFSRYANEENGFLGQDEDENNVFFTNTADYYFEILKIDSDEKVNEGELGRIVITDFFNLGLPMIRYDTGDIGKLEYRLSGNRTRQAITSFFGRRVDVISNTQGNPISPDSLTNSMWEFDEIMQFQIIQREEKAYYLKLNTDKNIDESKIKKKLMNILGEDADILVEYTNDIPVLNSGKRRSVVNEMRGKDGHLLQGR